GVRLRIRAVTRCDNGYSRADHKSLTATHPGTLVASVTARTIASANTSAAIAPSAVSEIGEFKTPVATASTWSPSFCVWYGLIARAAPVFATIASFVNAVLV